MLFDPQKGPLSPKIYTLLLTEAAGLTAVALAKVSLIIQVDVMVCKIHTSKLGNIRKIGLTVIFRLL